LITNYGKSSILNYFAGNGTAVADAILIGVGSSPTEECLNYEIERLPVKIVGLDYNNSQVIFKTTLPVELNASISEVGLFVGQDFAAQENSTLPLFPGGSANAEWSIANVSTGRYIKEESLRVNNFTYAENFLLDISTFNEDDYIKFLISSDTAATFKMRIGTDANNYHQYSFNVTSGKNVIKKNISDRTTSGQVDLTNITYISLQSSVSVILEGVRLEEKLLKVPTFGVVAYQVLSTPLDKFAGEEKEIEYALTIGI